MLFSRFRDKQLRLKYLKTENKLKIIKFLNINILGRLSNSKTKTKQGFALPQAFLTYKKGGIKTKIVRRSLFRDHTKSNYRPLNLSRFVFRDLLRFGLIPGYKKAVW